MLMQGMIGHSTKWGLVNMKINKSIKKLLQNIKNYKKVLEENISMKKDINKMLSTIEELNNKIDEYELLLDKDLSIKKIEELEYLLNQYRNNKRELQKENKQLRRENLAYYIELNKEK